MFRFDSLQLMLIGVELAESALACIILKTTLSIYIQGYLLHIYFESILVYVPLKDLKIITTKSYTPFHWHSQIYVILVWRTNEKFVM